MLRTFVNMPMPLKIVAVVAGGGGLMSIIWLIEPRLVYVVLIGLMVLAMLLVGFRFILKKIEKRKAKSMEGEIGESSGAKPLEIKKADDYARLEDIRRKFEEGIGTFQTAGKSLYSLPWYLIVGEPGSGKTEAVRHCNVGFPPGLQDAYQGVGGTINMNWWFTDHAVLLDTAGRLMFEEVQAGTTSEWKEFLKLLKKNRPNCPVNGMFLFVPADSLIKDTADDIERKASQIAQQFDVIQRTLDVRFPVFVVVSKSDLINGFREFFDNLDDPKLQHQIMGWSNPDPLDEPFKPELIDDHLRQIQKRLFRRRLGLMQDPIPEDIQARRTDEVDALFAFPQSLVKISPRLQRYLELIFSVGSQWSGKPLFLRGIYFTSSMREGSALDEDLAEALGVPVDSLPEGRVWEQDRAYFLRDLFIEKVFRERGLVTSATNAKRQHTRRKMSVVLSGMLAVVILLFLTWFGGYSLSKSIGVHRSFWITAQYEGNWQAGMNNHQYWKPVVYPEYHGSTIYDYTGSSTLQFPEKNGKKLTTIEIEGEPINSYQFHEELNKLAQEDIHIPWVFRLAATLGNNINNQRQKAQQVLFNHSVVWPLLDYSREKMKVEEPDEWTAASGDTAALTQLLRVEALAYYGKSFHEKGKYPDLDALMNYVLYRRSEDDSEGKFEKNYQKWEAQREVLQDVLNSIYSRMDRDDFQLLTGGKFLQQNVPIRKGVLDFEKSSVSAGERGALSIEKVYALIENLKKFNAEEESILKFGGLVGRDIKDLKTYIQLENYEKDWQGLMQAITKTRKEIDLAADDVLGGRTLMIAYDEAVREAVKQIEMDFKLLSNEIPPEEKKAGFIKGLADKAGVENEDVVEQIPEEPILAKKDVLIEVREMIKKATQVRAEQINKRALEERDLLAQLHADFLKKEKNDRYIYDNRSRAYAIANDELTTRDPLPEMNGLADALKNLEEDLNDARSEIDGLLDGQHEISRQTAQTAHRVLELAHQKRVYQMLRGVLSEKVPNSVREIERIVENNAQILPPVRRPLIPLTAMEGGEFEAKYHPQAAKALLGGWKMVRGYLLENQTGSEQSMTVVDRDELLSLYRDSQSEFSDYALEYFTYWTNTIFEELSIVSKNWKEFHENIEGLRVRPTCTRLLDLYEKINDALTVEIRDMFEDDRHMKSEFARVEEAVQNALKALEERSHQTDYGDLVDNWVELGRSSQPLQVLLNDYQKLPRRRFMEKYFPFSEEEEETAVTNIYWANISHLGLRLLTFEYVEEINQTLETLEKQYSRFPLALPSVTKQELTSDEVMRMHEVLKRIVSVPIENIGIKSLDREFERLRSPAQGKEEWLERLVRVINALPESQPFQCQIYVLGNEEQVRLLQQAGRTYENDRMELIWKVIALEQGSVQKGKIRTGQPANELLGGIKYPGEAMTLKFYTHADSAEPSRKLALESIWGGLRLIHAGQLKDQEGEPRWSVGERLDDGKKWNIEVVIQDDLGKERSLWLQLEFEYALPEISEWPDK